MPAGKGRIGQTEQNHMVVVSFQQMELSAVAAATPAPEPNPLHSSQPMHSRGSWQGLPAGCFCFLTYMKCERSPKLQGGKDQHGASFPLLDETSAGANRCCIMQTAPALH